MEYELREWRLSDAERLSPEGLRYTPMRFTESR